MKRIKITLRFRCKRNDNDLNPRSAFQTDQSLFSDRQPDRGRVPDHPGAGNGGEKRAALRPEKPPRRPLTVAPTRLHLFGGVSRHRRNAPPGSISHFSRRGKSSGRFDATLPSLLATITRNAPRCCERYFRERRTRFSSSTWRSLSSPSTYMTGLFLERRRGCLRYTETLDISSDLYRIIFHLVIAFQGSRGAAWRALMERVTAVVPILGSARHDLALSRLSAALEAFQSACRLFRPGKSRPTPVGRTV